MRTSVSALVAPAEYGATRWVILAVVAAAQFLGTFDLWVVTIALPALQREFAPAALPDVAWILNVYTIVLATFLAPAGRIADSVGRKRAFVVGLTLFGLASLGCALAPSLPVVIAWRTVQALGAAIVLPTSLGLALPAFPQHERATAVGIWAAVSAAAAGSGPVLGGLLVEFSWRWIFLINAPIVVATVLAGIAILPRDNPRGALRIDGVGMLLVLGAMGLVSAGLIQASTWPAHVVWPMIGAGLVLAIAFVFHAVRHPDPVIPPRLFAARRYRISAMGLLGYHVGFAMMLLGTTLLLTDVLHLSVLQAALGIAPGPISAGVASPFSGRLNARLGVRRMLLVGAALFGAAAAWPLLVAATGAAPSYVAWVLPTLLLWGIANAFIQPTFFAGADAAPRDDLSLGTAVLAASRQVGAALGVATLVALLAAAGATPLLGFQLAWMIVLASAASTAIAGLLSAPASASAAPTRPQADRSPAPAGTRP
jgi:EmrB/QacA subfamily drug resistance transporter